MQNDMRDRLVELLGDYLYSEQIADHLIANGVIVPPCKVGDTVYRISTEYYSKRKYIKETKISRIAIDDNGIRVFCANTPNVSNIWGNTVFLTFEAAEKAIQKRSDNNEPSNGIKL